MKRKSLMFGCVLFGAVVVVGYISKRYRHTVVYKVHGNAKSKFVIIKYLDTPAYGGFNYRQLKRVRVPATALPWTKTVRLPTESMTHVSVSNEQGKKSMLLVNITVDKWETTARTEQVVEELSHGSVIDNRR